MEVQQSKEYTDRFDFLKRALLPFHMHFGGVLTTTENGWPLLELQPAKGTKHRLKIYAHAEKPHDRLYSVKTWNPAARRFDFCEGLSYFALLAWMVHRYHENGYEGIKTPEEFPSSLAVHIHTFVKSVECLVSNVGGDQSYSQILFVKPKTGLLALVDRSDYPDYLYFGFSWDRKNMKSRPKSHLWIRLPRFYVSAYRVLGDATVIPPEELNFEIL